MKKDEAHFFSRLVDHIGYPAGRISDFEMNRQKLQQTAILHKGELDEWRQRLTLAEKDRPNRTLPPASWSALAGRRRTVGILNRYSAEHPSSSKIRNGMAMI